MPWFRLEDSFHSHPKVIAAGNEAVGLYVRCGTYAAEHLTDGFIPEHVALLYGRPALVEALVRTKLWRRTRGGYRMPDYLDYNPSREAVDNSRRQVAERQKRWRDNRKLTNPLPAAGHNEQVTAQHQLPVDNSRDPGNSTSEAHRRRVTNASDNGRVDAYPARPAPKEAGRATPAPNASARASPSGSRTKPQRPEDRTVAEALAESRGEVP